MLAATGDSHDSGGLGVGIFVGQTLVEIEIDFAVQTENRVIPIEVKSEESVRSKSLKTYIDKNPSLKGLRVSMKNYIDQGWMENIGLYAIEGFLRKS